MDAKKLSNQEKLDHMFEMVNELNHEMHEMKKKEAAEGAYKLFYMTLVIIALGGVYYFVSPLFNAIKKAPELIDTSMQKIQDLKKNIPNPATLQQAVDSATNGIVTKENLGTAKDALDQAKKEVGGASR
jgi:predicted PurR-regulated permease PerM